MYIYISYISFKYYDGMFLFFFESFLIKVDLAETRDEAVFVASWCFLWYLCWIYTVVVWYLVEYVCVYIYIHIRVRMCMYIYIYSTYVYMYTYMWRYVICLVNIMVYRCLFRYILHGRLYNAWAPRIGVDGEVTCLFGLAISIRFKLIVCKLQI